ncbi:hypothetical protein [Streptomyces sp. NPDC058086]|uniref:hypothetical protein n=1 Tax=Streptomyces sp. NPDC058086 TaxID=3346334 RepID=UPI0036EA038C
MERPTLPGTEQVAVRWGHFDEPTSCTWDVEPGRPMTVHVHAPGDSMRPLLNDAGVPGGAATPERAMATFTVPYAPGESTTVAGRDGEEIGRTTLVTAGAPAACGSFRTSRFSPRAATTSRTCSSK